MSGLSGKKTPDPNRHRFSPQTPKDRTMANHYNDTDAINSQYLIHYYLEGLAMFDINPNVDDYSSLLYAYLRFMSITSLERWFTSQK